MSINRYRMSATTDPGVCATAEDGHEIYPAEYEPEFCLSSDVLELEAENQQLRERIAELEKGDPNAKLRREVASMEKENADLEREIGELGDI